MEKDAQYLQRGEPGELAEYFAIIPARVMFDKELKSMDIHLFAIIAIMSVKHSFCWPKNQYLAQRLNISERTIQRSLDRLIKKGYIKRIFGIEPNDRYLAPNLHKKNVDTQINM